MEYNFREIEKKWQKRWVEEKTYQVTEEDSKQKFYVLNMFPYPSGAGLHVGHPLGYIASDIYARYKRLQGFNVLNPMGYDAYGLPAEQYAIQTGQHPAITTVNNINRYREQLDKIGFSFDWNREIRTCDPEYYHWTQWAFQKMFNSYYCNDEQEARPIEELEKAFAIYGNEGLNAACSKDISFTAEEWNAKSEKEKQEVLMNYRIAYLGETMVNWCAELGTVLANDEVVDGVSERGGFPVIQKKMRQWCLRVSAYAQRLLDGLDTIEWTDSLKETQRNWIGRSEGAEVQFKVKDSDLEFTIFTTRADTMFGVTFMVLAPESELVAQLTTPEQKAEVDAYLDRTKKRTERERIADRSVTGVFSGSYAINPFTGEAVPVWISDYVLAGYGTGAIMAVPAHDSRDYAFAKHFGLEIRPLVEGCDVSEESFDAKEGIVCNSPRLDVTPYCDLSLNGLTIKEAIETTKKYVKEHNLGRVKVNYRLRDAIFSRQRYWGEPFPVYYKDGMPYMIDEASLPLELPEVAKFLPTETGEPPLGHATKWAWDTVNKCVVENEKIDHVTVFPLELNTMPGFAGSSAYYLRYMDPHNHQALVDPKIDQYWKNVDLYVGGTEHATGHLIYSRFWNKFLYDIGIAPTKEPYAKRTSHGMILGENGEKMSKSRGNVVNPDDIIREYGADTMRLYEMFIGDFEKAAPWSTASIKGCRRFLERFWNLQEIMTSEETLSPKLEASFHRAIKKIGEDIETLKFNTAIATLMALLNDIYDIGSVTKGEFRLFTVLLNLFAPHICEEVWEHSKLGDGMVCQQQWPEYDESKCVDKTIEIAVQVCGKIRCRLEVAADIDAESAIAAAKADSKVAAELSGKQIVKEIYVPGKLVNIVAK